MQDLWWDTGKNNSIKGPLMPRENIQKVDGEKNKADDNVRALNTHLPVHQGQDRALEGSAHTFHTNWNIPVSLSSFWVSFWVFCWHSPRAQGAARCSPGSSPCCPRVWGGLCGLRARWALGQGAPTILSLVLLLPGRSPCSRVGMEETLKCFIVQECFLKRCC